MVNNKRRVASKPLIVYLYPPCSTCRDAVKWLQARGYALESHNLWEEAPSATQLKEWIRLSGLPIQRWFNVSGEAYREMGLKTVLPGMSEDEKIVLLSSNGRLIKRPIVTDGTKVTIGFKPALYEENW